MSQTKTPKAAPKKVATKKIDYPDWSITIKIYKIQNEIGAISKDATNPFFKSKYADINSMLQQLQPLFLKYGVTIEQPTSNGRVYTILTCIETGQSKSADLELQMVSDPQKLGSTLTYFRRYTFQSLLGLNTEDDDANTASGKTVIQTKSQANNQHQPAWLKEKQF